jgi:hypothetical protein
MFIIKALHKNSLSSNNLYLSEDALLVPKDKAKIFKLEIEAINFLKSSKPFISSNWSFVVVASN